MAGYGFASNPPYELAVVEHIGAWARAKDDGLTAAMIAFSLASSDG